MIPAGDGASDILAAGGAVKELTGPQLEADAYLSFIADLLDAVDGQSPDPLEGVGFGLFGWAHVEALRIAAELPGGLSRSNLLLAMRSLDLVHPMLLDGISFSMNGVEDAYYIEGSDFRQYDAASQEWVQVGDVIDINGMTPNCSWVDGRCE
jgi:hypothetical protein